MRRLRVILLLAATLAAGCGKEPTRSAPSSSGKVGTMPVDVAMLDAEPPTSKARGCEAVDTIDLRRPLSREMGLSGDPQPGGFESAPGFYRVQQPERVPEPGVATIAGLRLVMTVKPGARAGEPLSLTTRWVNDGTSNIVAVRPIELSALGIRGPAWQVLAKDRASGRLYRHGYRDTRTCDELEPITQRDYVEIAPGAQQDTGFAVPTESGVSLPKGSFDVFVSYRFCGFPVPSGLLGSPTQQSDILREDATQGRASSNVVTIDVE
ncbi:MAG: hypothetical protein JNL21_19135 [Myxococcales bacterium]|nr:hypothetical protein [Myxococcales bacterium]